MTPNEIVMLAVVVAGALVAIGRWVGGRDAEAQAKETTRSAIQEMRGDMQRIIGKLDTLAAVAVRVDRVEADVREVRSHVDEHKDRIARLEGRQSQP